MQVKVFIVPPAEAPDVPSKLSVASLDENGVAISEPVVVESGETEVSLPVGGSVKLVEMRPPLVYDMAQGAAVEGEWPEPPPPPEPEAKPAVPKNPPPLATKPAVGATAPRP